MNDWRGTPVEIGSTVVYASSASNNIMLTEGVVVQIEPSFKVKRTRGYYYGNTDYEDRTVVSTLRRPDRITVIP